MKNEIYLRRKGKVLLEDGVSEDNNINYVATILKNIEPLGYTFSKNLIEKLCTYDVKQLESFYVDIISSLKKLVGAHVKHRPMYPNFPQQVMEMDEVELYVNAVIHYLSRYGYASQEENLDTVLDKITGSKEDALNLFENGKVLLVEDNDIKLKSIKNDISTSKKFIDQGDGTLLPDYEIKERTSLFEPTKIKVIDLGNQDDFNSIFRNLLKSKTSISDTDKKDMEWFVKNNTDKLNEILPEEIPLKENVALFVKLLLENVKNVKYLISKYIKTATDVLRLAVALSDGDISLATNTKFRSYKRKERRLLLSLLNQCNNIEEDMIRYKNIWIRLGERLHPSEPKHKKYYKANIAFNKLRNNSKIETYKSKVNKLIMLKEHQGLFELLKERPGEFARSLDLLLRTYPTLSDTIVDEFKKVAINVSVPVLLQVAEHFRNRNKEKEIRAFFPKGNVAKVYGIDYNLFPIWGYVCGRLVNICENTLINIFKEKESLGNVYIDERLKGYLVPFSQRSASKALKTIVRGSKIDISEINKTIRPFIYWKGSGVDIDLSAVIYNSDWNYLKHISYTNLRSAKYNVYHSGDITSAPQGASEFIDLDIKSILECEGRYVVISILSYSRQPFIEISECFMGWMSRQQTNSGEIYEPKTVQNKIDITANTTICIPMILDLQQNKIIWTDIALRRHPNWQVNVEGNQKGMVLIGKAMASLVKPNLYDLFKLHTLARGTECGNIEEADTIFSLDTGVTPFDIDIIIGEYL